MEAQQTSTEPVVELPEEPTTPEQGNLNQTPEGRTVRSVGHGGRVVPRAGRRPDADPPTSTAPLLYKTEQAVLRDFIHRRFDATTSFDYMFRGLRADPAAHLPAGTEAEVAATVAALEKLGVAMVERPDDDSIVPLAAGQSRADRDSTVPAVYTYWGQFIDHDITLNTNGPDGPPKDGDKPRPGDVALGDIINEPFSVVPPDTVVASLHNGRHPFLNLDSLYGSGPRFPGEKDRGTTRSEEAYAKTDPTKLALGRVSTDAIPGFQLVEPGDDAQRDLPRFSTSEVAGLDVPDDEKPAPGTAKIPDGRNDENLVVAQLHLGHIRFHNAVVDWVRTTEPWRNVSSRAVFNRAQQLVRYHYQWLVLNDYLRTLTKPGVLDQVLLEQSTLFRPRRRVAMPLEFAVAAFRFGHSMARNGYDYNVNFTRGARFGAASLTQLFQFTGGGGLSPNPAQPSDVLPSNWPIDWSGFLDKGDADRVHGARKIDPFLADDLGHLIKEGWKPDWTAGPDGTVIDGEGNPVPPQQIPKAPSGLPITHDMSTLLKQLARRNLMRGYWLSLPTGEAVAKSLKLDPLSFEELTDGAADGVADALRALGGTPLWYYVLKEAQLQGNGNFLGEVGSRILCETFVYLLRMDEDSFMNHRPSAWTPAEGVRLENGRMITTLTELLRFAGVAALDDGSFRQVDDKPAGHDGD